MVQGGVLSSPVPNSEHASLEGGLADSIIIGEKLIFPHTWIRLFKPTQILNIEMLMLSGIPSCLGQSQIEALIVT